MIISDDISRIPEYDFKTFYKILNLDDSLKEHIPSIKQAFIDYYGEENKDYIDKKFDSLVFFGYFDPANFKFDPGSFGELTYKLLNKLNLKDDNYTFYSRKIFGINGIVDGNIIEVVKYFNGNKRCADKAAKLLNKFYPEVTKDNIDSLNQQGMFSAFHEWILENKEYIDFYIEMCKLRKSSKQLKKKLEKEYFFKLIEEYNDYLPDKQDIVKNKEFILSVLDENGFSEYFGPYSWYWIMFGKNICDTPSIDSFSEQTEELLNNEETPFFKKDSIKRTRLEVLRLLAKDPYGRKSYDILINDKQLMSQIPSASMITIISERRKELYLEMREKYLSLVDEKYLKKQEKFKQIKNKYKSTLDERTILEVDGNCYCGADFSVIRLNLDGTVKGMDSTIIHEINHAVENYKRRSGWTSKKYLYLNEAVNELIAQKITKIMHNKGNFIFTPQLCTINDNDIGNSGYQKLIILIEGFFNEFKDEILESRKNGNIDVIFSTVGKENFDALADLVTCYQNEFENDYINLEKDLKLKQNSERTQKHYKFLEKRDQILAAMRKYKAEHVNANKTI